MSETGEGGEASKCVMWVSESSRARENSIYHDL